MQRTGTDSSRWPLKPVESARVEMTVTVTPTSNALRSSTHRLSRLDSVLPLVQRLVVGRGHL